MSQNLTIKLNQTEMKRLSRLALRYGLSLPEFARKVLAELNEAFPDESFADYQDAEGLKSSFERALSDWRSGRVQTQLRLSTRRNLRSSSRSSRLAYSAYIASKKIFSEKTGGTHGSRSRS
jgi:hypothetical protein